MDLKKLKCAYRSQRDAATKKRGIDWQFTWETWLAWWGEDIVNRGCRGGQLVQARKGDIGPYSPDNCIKLTAEQNASDGQKGKPKSSEHCANISAAHLGQTHSAEARARISAAKKGKIKSAEHKARISAALKGKKRGPYKKRQTSK